MFTFKNFSWLLQLICTLNRSSGYLFTSINFDTLENSITKRDFIFFFISFVLSVLANSYDANLPVAEFTKSKLMGAGVNSIIRMVILSGCILKVINLCLRKRFFEIMFKLHRNNIKVSFK